MVPCSNFVRTLEQTPHTRPRTLLQEAQHSMLPALRLPHAAAPSPSALFLGVRPERTVQLSDGLSRLPPSAPPTGNARHVHDRRTLPISSIRICARLNCSPPRTAERASDDRLDLGISCASIFLHNQYISASPYPLFPFSTPAAPTRRAMHEFHILHSAPRCAGFRCATHRNAPIHISKSSMLRHLM